MDVAPQSSKPPCDRDDALAIVRALRDAGHTAYFAGGCVRDQLLGLTPKDYDVATSAVPQMVRALFRNTQAVGHAFGVILVRLGRSIVEVATFRSDGAYLDGRRPAEVRFTSAEDDAKRRDFTINGLFFDPIDERVLDYVGGQADLKQGIVRAIGEPEERFAEDHLRLLRAVRFASRFGFAIELRTANAILAHARQMIRISPERIGEELRLMLTPPQRIAAWRHLCELAILPVVLRFAPRPARLGEATPPDLFPVVAVGGSIGFGLALAALTLGNAVTMAGRAAWDVLLAPANVRGLVQACRKGMKISNEDSQAMAGALDILHLLRDPAPTVATMKRFLARPAAADARRMLDAMAAVDPGLARVPWLRERFAELEKTDCAPPPLITGDDLAAAGLTPGPLFKRVLDAVYDAQLEGELTEKSDAMKLALELSPI